MGCKPIWVLCLFLLFFERYAYNNNDLSFVPVPPPTKNLINILGEPALDLRDINPGDLITFDIHFENVDFTFAAAEFLIYHPIALLTLSENDSDWEAGNGAVFVPGRDLICTDYMVLPVDEAGNRTAAKVDLFKTRIGLVITNPNKYWYGTPSNPHPGGHIGSISYVFNPNQTSSCSSQIEPVQILVNPMNQNGLSDYFSDQNGDRVPLVSVSPTSIFGLEGLSAYLGDPTKTIRADGNLDGLRTSADALPAARCALLGQNNASCHPVWQTQPVEVFTQTFDFDCSGTVSTSDALGMARLALGLRERTSIAKNAGAPLKVRRKNSESLQIAHEDREASLVWFSLETGGSQALEPFLEWADQVKGWTLEYEQRGNILDILLVSAGVGRVPKISFPISKAKTNPTFKLVEVVYLDEGKTEAYWPLRGGDSVRGSKTQKVR